MVDDNKVLDSSKSYANSRLMKLAKIGIDFDMDDELVEVYPSVLKNYSTDVLLAFDEGEMIDIDGDEVLRFSGHYDSADKRSCQRAKKE